jgi:hypothetical protein
MDVLYDPVAEVLRGNSTFVLMCACPAMCACADCAVGNGNKVGKLCLWNVSAGAGWAFQALELSVFVDRSVIKVYANNATVITTRTYL